LTGGFDLGFEQAGLHCAWQVEIDTRCNEVLAYHWPDVKRYGDVRDVGQHNLKAVDIITGGFPCQGLSVAGRRAGLADERSGLWWEFHRIIDELRPRWIVIENVPGLLSSSGGRDMGAIVGALAKLRYGWAYRVLDAQFYGVAQRRRRVFIVGCLGDWTSATKVLFEPESLCWNSAPRREAGAKVTAYTPAGFGEYSQRKGTLRSSGGDCGGGSEMLIVPDECDIVKHALSGHNQRNDPDGEHFVIEAYQCHGGNVGPMGTLRKSTGGLTGGVPFIATAYTIQTNDGGKHKRKDRLHGGMYVKETEQALTLGSSDQTVVAFDWQSGGDVRLNVSEEHTSALQASQTPAVMERMGIRRLTVTECERLMGFSDGHTAVNEMKDTPRYRMLGNAVCVPVAKWIGERIITATE